MSDLVDLTLERFARMVPRDFLITMCCEPLQFMWDNFLLSARDEWVLHENGEMRIQARTLVGFRVVRQFWMFKRDQIFYKCPFCSVELVFPLGYIADQTWLAIPITKIGRDPNSPLKLITKALLERELAETKRRNRAGWPPKD